MEHILIIGYGKLGSHLYCALKSAGKRYAVTVIKNKKPNAAVLKKQIEKAGIIFICVQDSNITGAVKLIDKTSAELKGKFVFHTSGALTSDELAPLSKNGAYTASFHPVQTFEKKAIRQTDRFKEIYIALEGNKTAVKKAVQVAKQLRSNSFIIKKENKVYHHICCVMASNYLTVLNSKIEEAGSKKIQINGFNKLKFFNIYMPLALQTLRNISILGPKASLTGPIERNDAGTLESHLKALSKTGKDILFYYILMGIETVKLALKKKSLKKSEANKIYKLFSKYIKLQ